MPRPTLRWGPHAHAQGPALFPTLDTRHYTHAHTLHAHTRLHTQHTPHVYARFPHSRTCTRTHRCILVSFTLFCHHTHTHLAYTLFYTHTPPYTHPAGARLHGSAPRACRRRTFPTLLCTRIPTTAHCDILRNAALRTRAVVHSVDTATNTRFETHRTPHFVTYNAWFFPPTSNRTPHAPLPCRLYLPLPAYPISLWFYLRLRTGVLPDAETVACVAGLTTLPVDNATAGVGTLLTRLPARGCLTSPTCLPGFSMQHT